MPGGIAHPLRVTVQRKPSRVHDGRQDASANGAQPLHGEHAVARWREQQAATPHHSPCPFAKCAACAARECQSCAIQRCTCRAHGTTPLGRRWSRASELRDPLVRVRKRQAREPGAWGWVQRNGWQSAGDQTLALLPGHKASLAPVVRPW